MEPLGPYLVDFTDGVGPEFRPIDDQVMGGRSVSRWRRDPGGFGVFEGLVSLAQGGGFASVRAALANVDLASHRGIRLRIRGDGQRYRIILRNDRGLSGINHMHDVVSRDGEWHEETLAFADFRPSLRGHTPTDAPELDPARIRQLGFMIADGQAGPFHFEVAWVRGAG